MNSRPVARERYHELHFSKRHWFVSTLSQYCPDMTYKARSGVAKGLKRKGGLGFMPGFLAEDTAEVRFLNSLQFSGMVVYDIGGFQGLMTLRFAKEAKRVVTFEANPINMTRIAENVRLNGFDHCLLLNGSSLRHRMCGRSRLR